MAQPANDCPHHKGARMRKLPGEEYWRCAPASGAACKYTRQVQPKGKR